jgi:tetratricopeptide (TPR) repeat protein
MKYFTLIILCFTVFVYSCKSKKNAATGNHKSALKTTKEYLDDLKKQKISSLIIEGTTAKSAGNIELAFTKFDSCLSIDPACATAMYHLSGLYDISGRKIRALEMAEKAAQLEPQNKWFLLQLAYLYQSNKYYKETVQTFEKLIKNEPENTDYYFPYSDALLMMNQPEKAIEALNKAEKLMGKREDIIFQKYRIYSFLKKHDKALEEIQSLLNQNPNEPRYYGIMAEIFEEMGQSEKALEYYHKVLELDPQNGMVHLSLAEYYKAKRNELKRKEELQKAFQSPNIPIDIKMQILLEYLDQPAKTEEAYELLEILIAVHADEAKAWSIYGDFLVRDNKTIEARDKFRKAVALEKNVFPIWNEICILNSQLQDNESLYNESRTAMELFPTQPGFYYFNGFAAMQKNLYKEASETLQEGLNYVIGNKALQAEFYQLLGDCYHKLQEHKKSDEYYDKALAINPDNVYVLNNYAYYLCLRKINLDKAAEMSKKSNDLQPNQASFLDTYGWILFVQKKYEEAEKWLKQALEKGGNNSGTILEHYGDVLFMLQKHDEALKYWKQAKEKGDTGPAIDKKINDKKYYE